MLESFLSNSKSAIVLVDMQEDFVSKLRPGAAERIVPAQRQLLIKARRFKTKTAVLEIDGYGHTLPELLGAMNEADFRRFSKKYNSGFVGTSLTYWLANGGVEQILFVGINAGYCVKESAEDALTLGYSILTSPQLIAGQSHHDSDDYIGWYGANGSLLEL